jgi:hypothetical protein
VCDWIETVSSVTKVMDILEYVSVGTRTWRFGTVTLFTYVLSTTVKSVCEKCWLHTYCFCSFLVCFELQALPSLSVHMWAFSNNKITNYRNETVITMVSDFRYISTSTLCCTGYTPYWSNTQNYFWMLHKTNDGGLRWINSRHYLKIHNVEITT